MGQEYDYVCTQTLSRACAKYSEKSFEHAQRKRLKWETEFYPNTHTHKNPLQTEEINQPKKKTIRNFLENGHSFEMECWYWTNDKSLDYYLCIITICNLQLYCFGRTLLQTKTDRF